MATKKTKSKSSTGKVLAVSAGIAALGAGAYLLFGPDAKKNQKKAKGWLVKMKGEIIEKMEQAKEVTAPVFSSIVDEVGTQYSKAKNIDTTELRAGIADIKRQWKGMAKHAANTGKKTAKTAKSTLKRTLK